MSRVVFGPEDLIKVRVVAGAGPIAETVFALDVVDRPGNAALGSWMQHVNVQINGRSDVIRTLTRSLRPVPDLLWALESPLAPPQNAKLRSVGLSSSEVLTAIHGFCQLAVMPIWARVRRYLEAERDTRGRILMTGGLDRLLGTLHPQMRWEPPVLEIPDERDTELRLDGRSLLLAPSLFMCHRPAVLIGATGLGGQPILSFSTPPNLKAANELWGPRDRNDQALSALIGKTRAAVLDALTDSSTTGELATRLGISAAAVSQHTGVLRAAGLISTRRNRNTVLHTLTTMGRVMLAGQMVSEPDRAVRAAV